MSDDNCGYGKPPRHSRFRKGVSGNPKGRPKGSLSFKQKLRKMANQSTTVRWQGKVLEVSMAEALFYAAMSAALKGNVTLTIWLLEFMLAFDETDGGGGNRESKLACGVLVVPGMMEVDDWEKLANEQQAQYRGSVGDPP